MKVLIDRDDLEPVCLTNHAELIPAVRAFLTRREYMDKNYFNDGQISLSGEEFLGRQDLVRQAFALIDLEVID